MNEGRTVFSQLMDFLPKHEFDKCVARYQGNFRSRKFPAYEQFLVLAFAQLTWRESLWDIETCLASFGPKLYHAGIRQQMKAQISARMKTTGHASRCTASKMTGNCGRVNFFRRLWCRWWDSNPHDFLWSQDFKSCASAISPHRLIDKIHGDNSAVCSRGPAKAYFRKGLARPQAANFQNIVNHPWCVSAYIMDLAC